MNAATTARAGPRPRAAETDTRRGPRAAGGRVILLNKPYGVLCQFTADAQRQADARRFRPRPGCLPGGAAGCGQRRARGADRRRRAAGAHHAPVQQARENVLGPGRRHRPTRGSSGRLPRASSSPASSRRRAGARAIPEPRRPLAAPARRSAGARRFQHRGWKSSLTEGRNRQVRRMTAAVGPAHSAPHSLCRRSMDDRGPRARRVARGFRAAPRAMIVARPLHLLSVRLAQPPAPTVGLLVRPGRTRHPYAAMIRRLLARLLPRKKSGARDPRIYGAGRPPGPPPAAGARRDRGDAQAARSRFQGLRRRRRRARSAARHRAEGFRHRHRCQARAGEAAVPSRLRHRSPLPARARSCRPGNDRSLDVSRGADRR